MADDTAVLIGVGAIVAVGFGIWWLVNRQQVLGGGGGGLFGGGLGGGGTGGGSMVAGPHCNFYPSSGNYCYGPLVANGCYACAKGSCANAQSSFNSTCGRSGGGGGTPQGCDCNHLDCAGVRRCLERCPPFSTTVLNRCGIQNIGGSIITPGTGSTGGIPTTGGAIIPCIVDEATRRSKCPNLCSCTGTWFFQGTNTPCNPNGAEIAARRDQCGAPGGSVTPGFDISAGSANNPVSSSFVHRPLYNRVFYNPLDQMRLVIAS